MCTAHEWPHSLFIFSPDRYPRSPKSVPPLSRLCTFFSSPRNDLRRVCGDHSWWGRGVQKFLSKIFHSRIDCKGEKCTSTALRRRNQHLHNTPSTFLSFFFRTLSVSPRRLAAHTSTVRMNYFFEFCPGGRQRKLSFSLRLRLLLTLKEKRHSRQTKADTHLYLYNAAER